MSGYDGFKQGYNKGLLNAQIEEIRKSWDMNLKNFKANLQKIGFMGKSRKIKVYIASPYRIGDMAYNVKRQIDCADALIDYGFVPFIPLLSHFYQMIRPRREEEWLDIDLEWVKVCDCVLRLSGESVGADLEVQFANENGIPVFNSVYDVQQYWKK